jgi:hypothetical protein
MIINFNSIYINSTTIITMVELSTLKCVFLGGGIMASAMVGGLLKGGAKANQITVVELLEDQRRRLT